jgi:glucokinase
MKKDSASDEVLALDLGGSKLALATVSRDGAVGRHERTPTAGVRSGDDLVAWVKGRVQSWGLAPRALGISSGGPLDDERGMVTTWPRMERLWGYPMTDELRRALPGLETVRLVNDACAACAGEVVFGAARGCKSALYLTISTGIGGGAVIGGMLLRGDRGNVAEFGHTIVRPGGPRCDCGGVGCLEATSSASGLYRQLVEAGLYEAHERGWADLGPWLSERLAAADARVGAVWSEAMVSLAIGIVNLWHSYVPRAIVVGGGLSQLVQSSSPGLESLVRERARLIPFPETVLRYSENRHTIPLLGAAAVAGGWIAVEA